MSVISVIVPVYNVEQYLQRCVNSILSQTFWNFDLVLVDDGSPDLCGELCEEISQKDSRVIVLHRENGGLSAARNTGIEWALSHSESQWITFIDSDDWIHPQYLECLLEAVLKSTVNISVCKQKSVEYVQLSHGILYKEKPKVELLNAEDLLINHEWNFNYAWGKLYAKSLFRELRYPEGKNFEDTFTTYQALFACDQIVWLDRELYYYFKNDEGISHSPWDKKELVVLEGMRQQMAFYQQHGYTRAFEKEKQLYVNHHAYQISRIRANKPDFYKNKVYLRKLKKEMMKMIRKSPEKYGYSIMPQCYEAAYPTLMRCYHKFGSIIRNVLRNKGITN